jgi:hypothetical protein
MRITHETSCISQDLSFARARVAVYMRYPLARIFLT